MEEGYVVVKLIGLVIFIVIVTFYSFKSHYIRWVQKGENEILSFQNSSQNMRPLESLPPLLQNYLKKVIVDEELFQKKISHIHLTQKGLFWLKNEGTGMGFEANQVVSLATKDFSWFAQIRMTGISVYVTDRLINKIGLLRASILGIYTVAEESGESIYQGQVLRYLAELPWYPLAILKENEIQWEQPADNKLIARFKGTNQVLKVEYLFNDDGLIEKIYTEDRFFSEKKAKYPWVGEFSKYQNKNGILIPCRGEVSWIINSEKFTYFKGDVQNYYWTAGN